MAAILKLVCDSIMSMGLQNLQFATKIELLVKNNQPTTKNRLAFISMAAILYFSILVLIPYFDSVDPVLIVFSMLWTTYMLVFMLSSGSAHVSLLMLHIDSAIRAIWDFYTIWFNKTYLSNVIHSDHVYVKAFWQTIIIVWWQWFAQLGLSTYMFGT